MCPSLSCLICRLVVWASTYRCGYAPQITETCIPYLCRVLSDGSLAHLKSLNLSGNELGREGLVRLATALEEAVYAKPDGLLLESLDLSSSTLIPEGLARLCDSFKFGAGQALRHIHLKSCGITDVSLRCAAHWLSGKSCRWALS